MGKEEDVGASHLVRLLIAINGSGPDASRDPRYVISIRQYGFSQFWPGTGPWFLSSALNSYFAPTQTATLHCRQLVLRLGYSLLQWLADEAIWPYFAAHRELISEALIPLRAAKDYWFCFPRSSLRCSSDAFPEPPGDLVPTS